MIRTGAGAHGMAAGWARHRVAVLFAVALLARLVTLGNPVVHVDEQFYFAAAHAMWRGAVPYVDLWDRKPVGLFLLYMIPARLGLPWGIYAYQALALLSLTATAWLIMRMADRAGWRRGALFAGAACILWANLLEGQGGQSPIFYNLPMTLAATLLMRERIGRRTDAVLAMSLVGIALQIKYSVVFEGIFFGLWCMAREWRSGRRLLPTAVTGLILAGVALLPTIIVALYYLDIGHFADFWFANVTSITLRRPNPLGDRLGDLAGMVAILSPLLAMAILAARATRRTGWSVAQVFAFGWLASSVAGVAVFGTWFIHYALPILPPATLCAAGIVARYRKRTGAAALLLAVAVAGQIVPAAKLSGRGGGAQFQALADRADQPGCLFVYSGPPMLYAVSPRCRVTHYTFPTLLSRDRENGAIGVDQATEIRRIMAQAPSTVVMRRRYSGERGDIHALMIDALRRNYRLAAVLPMGDDRIGIYQRR